MTRPFFPLLLKRLNYLTAMGDKNIWGWRRGEKPDEEGYFLCARVNKRAERGQIDILKGNDVKEARNCKLQWEKRNVAFAATRAEYTVVLWHRVGGKATTEVWGLTFVAAGGLTIMHHLHIPDYLPTERELQLNSMHRAKRQWTPMF
jgi:hypothetical protein